jgi:DNA-directed RNA polymerase subunit RPC12/RpoP
LARKFDSTWAQVDPASGAPVAVAGAPDKPALGIECPDCGCRHFEVLQTRMRHGVILRRRSCRHCGHRITTRERLLSAK